jgi:hypothetical protein
MRTNKKAAPARAARTTPDNSGRQLVMRANPIVGSSSNETMLAAACAVSFLGRVASDRADVEGNFPSELRPLADVHHRGQAVLLAAIAGALGYEATSQAEGGAR